jgi:hypothetical protein
VFYACTTIKQALSQSVGKKSKKKNKQTTKMLEFFFNEFCIDPFCTHTHTGTQNDAVFKN